MRIGVKVFLGMLAVAIGVWTIGVPKVPDIDSESYLLMADGRMGEVVKPYANRALHPMVARLTQDCLINVGLVADSAGACQTGEGIDEARAERISRWQLAFSLVSLLALGTLVWSVVLLTDGALSPIGVFAVLGSPVLCKYVVNYYLPDIFYAALLGLWFLAIQRRRWLFVFLLLLLLQMSRESTLLIGTVFIGFCFFQKEWRKVFMGVTALLCGLVLVSMLTQSARPNIHEMGGVSYLFSKVVASSVANLLGITLWSDTYAQTLPHFYPDQPVWKMALPAVLAPGTISEIGIYRFEPWLPLRTLVMMLTTFGLLPFCLFYFRGAGVSKLKELPMGVGIALVCGICFWLLGPLTGRSVDRLIGYGWPAFWVAVPVIAASLPKAYLIKPRQAAWFWSGHLLLSWLPVVLKFC